MGGVKSGSKYRAVKQTVDGHCFDSKREAKRYGELKLLERAKEISGLTIQPKYKIAINGIPCFEYRADFLYHENGALVVEDAKGFRTEVYKIKKKCVEAAYGIRIRET